MNYNFEIPDHIKKLQTPDGFWDAMINYSEENGCTRAESFEVISGCFVEIFGYQRFASYKSLKKCYRDQGNIFTH